jgi:hypothetical protein
MISRLRRSFGCWFQAKAMECLLRKRKEEREGMLGKTPLDVAIQFPIWNAIIEVSFK